MADAVYNYFSKVDVLTNNAGMSPVAPSLLETSEALFDKIIGVNLKGPFRLSALVGSRMAAGNGGNIINISSIAAIKPKKENYGSITCCTHCGNRDSHVKWGFYIRYLFNDEPEDIAVLSLPSVENWFPYAEI